MNEPLFIIFSELPGLYDVAHVERVQEQTLEALAAHEASKEISESRQESKQGSTSSSPDGQRSSGSSAPRAHRLLLLLGALRSTKTSLLEDVYFRSTIGPVPIERILCDVLQSQPT